MEAAITLGLLVALVFYTFRNAGKRARNAAGAPYTDTSSGIYPMGHPLAHGSHHAHHDGRNDSRDDARDCGPVADSSPGWGGGDCSPSDSGGGDSGGSND